MFNNYTKEIREILTNEKKNDVTPEAKVLNLNKNRIIISIVQQSTTDTFG